MIPSLRSVVAALLLVLLTAFPLQPAAADQRADEQLFYALINELRETEGLQPLSVHPELVSEARLWAQSLASRGLIEHAGDLSVGVTDRWSLLGENVGVTNETVQVLFDAFVASPTHLQNLLDPDFDAIGVGVARGPDGRIFTVHRFMSLADEPEADAGPDGFVSLLQELDNAGV